MTTGNGRPDFNVQEAAAYIGKYLLVDVINCDLEGEVLYQQVAHGPIVRINLKDGLVIRLANGEERSLPPDVSFLEIAEPGTYTLNTGEIVENPDYTAVWHVFPKGYKA